MSGSTGQGDGSGDQGNAVSVTLSGGTTYSGAMATAFNSNHAEKKVCVVESNGSLIFAITGPTDAQITAVIDDAHDLDFQLSPDEPRCVTLANETGTITLRTRQDSYWESDEVATIFFYCDGTLFDTWTVTIFEAPEFISFANDTTINDDQLTTGFNTHTLPNDPVYIPQIHAASGRALDYILTEYSLPTCLWGPQGSDGHFNYVNSRQEDGLRFGRETFTLVARYALDPSFSDTISVTIAWADVDKAKSDLAAEYEAFLANDGLLALLAPAERAGQLEINLQNLASFGDSPEDSLSRTNVSYAIRFTELLQQNDLPYAARVTYCDGSEEIYSLPSEEQE